MEDDFAVNGGLEDRALGLEFFAELGGVDEIAVVRDRELAAVGIDDERLGVLGRAGPGGRVAHVADGASALELIEVVHLEDLRDKAHALCCWKVLSDPLAETIPALS